MADLTRKTANLYNVNDLQLYAIDNNNRYGVAFTEAGTYTATAYGLGESGDYFYIRVKYSDETWSSSQSIVNNATIRVQSVTISEGDTVYFYCATNANYGSALTKFNRWQPMINKGSTILPYEPYGWVHSLRKLTTATEAVENPLYSDGTAITAYTIKGNTVQSGTPSSQNPVMLNGTGERTANLVDESKVALNTFISYIGVTGSSTVSNLTDYIDISGSPFVISGVRTIGLLNPDTRGLCFYDSNKNFISGILYSPDVMSSPAVISNIPTNAKYVRFAFDKAFENGIMLNIGSTAKPYEPYGYKIPITSGGVTTNIYLGSTSSTRQIGKCILTGDEEYSRYDADRHVFRVTNTSAGISRLSGTSGICTHFERIGSQADLTDGQFAFGSEYIYFRIDSITYNPDFIAYIQEQYNNGTPVTVWYVLADEETAVVNEPLMKISDYSDSISNAVAIPTTDGANLITVDTTVQPSEFSATWTGWHDSSVKEYDGTDWQ